MPTVDEYKIAILHQLIEAADQGPGCVVQLQTDPSDESIRAVAELVIDGVLVFDEESPGCLMTDLGARKAHQLIRELKMKWQRQ